jgi:hypothetical protein
MFALYIQHMGNRATHEGEFQGIPAAGKMGLTPKKG